MANQLLSPTLDARVRAAWQIQLAASVRTSGLLRELMRRRADLLPCFAVQYQQLRTLPRRMRRVLLRRLRQWLAGAALLLALGQGQAIAATINVDDTCSLVDAITAANTVTGGCPAGSGADAILLTMCVLTQSSRRFGLSPIRTGRSKTKAVARRSQTVRSE